jgi:hypothetical protein
MTPEEFERIKEAEKEHLRALKKLKKAVRGLERSKSIAQSVTKMSSSSQSALETHENMVDKLALETAHYEARLDVALESAKEHQERGDADEALTNADAELQKERARSLVEQLREEMAVPDADTGEAVAESPGPRRSESDEQDDDAEDTGPLPEKTIGRMRRP